MGLKQLVSYILSVAKSRSDAEVFVHALAAILLLSAELLSIAATNHFIEPLAESMPSTYLAMMEQPCGHPV